MACRSGGSAGKGCGIALDTAGSVAAAGEPAVAARIAVASLTASVGAGKASSAVDGRRTTRNRAAPSKHTSPMARSTLTERDMRTMAFLLLSTLAKVANEAFATFARGSDHS